MVKDRYGRVDTSVAEQVTELICQGYGRWTGEVT
jgi:hypothetical protein